MNINHKTIQLRNSFFAIFGLTLLLAASLTITQTWAQQSPSGNATSTGNQTSGATNMTAAAAGDSEQRLSDFVKKLRTVFIGSGVNLTVPEGQSISEFVTNLNQSEGFRTLSEKFTQLAQQSGINASGERLSKLQGANLTGLADRLQQAQERIQTARAE
jgi:TolA-binding protein